MVRLAALAAKWSPKSRPLPDFAAVILLRNMEFHHLQTAQPSTLGRDANKAARVAPWAAGMMLVFMAGGFFLTKEALPVAPERVSIEALAASISSAWGREWKRPVRLKAVSAEAVQQKRCLILQRFISPASALLRQRAAVALGFRWDPPWQYAEALAGLTADLGAGCYDPELATFFYDASLKWEEEPQLRSRLVKSLASALVVQHFPAAVTGLRDSMDDDAATAAATAFAGEVAQIAAMCEMNLPQLRAADPGADNPATIPFYATPKYFREIVSFPGNAGMAWLSAQSTSWEDAANLPASTASVIHGSKIPPKVVAWPASDTAAAPAFQNVLGEFGILMLLKSQIEQSEAVRAATGWAGDRYGFFPGKAESSDSLLWRSEWLTGEDAREFAQALRRAWLTRVGWSDSPPDSGVFSLTINGQALRIEQRPGATAVTACRAPDTAAAQALCSFFDPPLS